MKNEQPMFQGYEEQKGAPPPTRIEGIVGTFPQVTTTPTWTPKLLKDSIAFDTTTGTIYYYDFTNHEWKSVSSGAGGSPGGSDTQIQFNDGGAFGGDAGLTYLPDAGLGYPAMYIGDKAARYLGIDLSSGGGIDLLTDDFAQGNELDGTSISLTAGNGDQGAGNNNTGGDINFFAGEGGTDGNGGRIKVESGLGTGGGNGGDIDIAAGFGGSDGFGGDINIIAGPAHGAGTGGGGSVHIQGGSAGSISSENGGDIEITPGSNGGGSGHEGDIKINNAMAIATSANGGFIVIPKCAGTPTGTPTSSGSLVYDTTNNKLYVYNGAWKSVTLT